MNSYNTDKNILIESKILDLTISTKIQEMTSEYLDKILSSIDWLKTLTTDDEIFNTNEYKLLIENKIIDLQLMTRINVVDYIQQLKIDSTIEWLNSKLIEIK